VFPECVCTVLFFAPMAAALGCGSTLVFSKRDDLYGFGENDSGQLGNDSWALLRKWCSV